MIRYREQYVGGVSMFILVVSLSLDQANSTGAGIPSSDKGF